MGVRVNRQKTLSLAAQAGRTMRFRALDAAGALQVDTEIPWFLNMFNCQELATNITRSFCYATLPVQP
jgi:hypothetical protein